MADAALIWQVVAVLFLEGLPATLKNPVRVT